MSSCPTGASCSSCTVKNSNCTNGDTKYKKTGCKSGYKDCNGSCISTSSCCGGCPSGQECSNGTCVSTEGTITIIHQLPSGFSYLGGGPWLSPVYKEPGETLYNINFPRGEANASSYSWSTTTTKKVKLGGELRVSIPDIQQPDGVYAVDRASPQQNSKSSYHAGSYGVAQSLGNGEYYFDIPKGSATNTITIYYKKVY